MKRGLMVGLFTFLIVFSMISVVSAQQESSNFFDKIIDFFKRIFSQQPEPQLAPTFYTGIPENFKPTIGYYLKFNGGNVGFWDENGNVYSSSNGIDFQDVSPQPGSVLEGFVPVAGAFHPRGGGRIVLYDSTGDGFISAGPPDGFQQINFEQAASNGFPLGFKPTEMYYHGFSGGRLVLTDIDGNWQFWNGIDNQWANLRSSSFMADNWNLLDQPVDTGYSFRFGNCQLIGPIGDMDGDGDIDNDDQISVSSVRSGGNTEFGNDCADLNGDGVVTFSDVALINEWVSGDYSNQNPVNSEQHVWYKQDSSEYGKVYSWSGPGTPGNIFTDITNEIIGLPALYKVYSNGESEAFVKVPDTGYYDVIRNKLVVWYETEAYESDDGRNFNLVHSTSPDVPICQPTWSCNQWSNAAQQCGTRTCNDLNNCGTDLDKPQETITCPIINETAVCGNNIIEAGEVCDGDAISCAFGNSPGVQICNAACSGYGACEEIICIDSDEITDSKEINEGTSKKIAGLDVEVVAADENTATSTISADLLVSDVTSINGTRVAVSLLVSGNSQITGYPLESVVINGIPYVVELTAASDSSATIRVTTGANYFENGNTFVSMSNFNLTNSDSCSLVLGYSNITGLPSGWQSVDSCSGEDCYVNEAFCKFLEVGIDAEADELYKCENGCSNGACLPVVNQTTTCTDSDGGIDYYERGQIEIKDAEGNIIGSDWDSCDEEEFFCNEDGSAGIIAGSWNCPNGCSNGACISGQEINSCSSLNKDVINKIAEVQALGERVILREGASINHSDYFVIETTDGGAIYEITTLTNSSTEFHIVVTNRITGTSNEVTDSTGDGSAIIALGGKEYVVTYNFWSGIAQKARTIQLNHPQSTGDDILVFEGCTTTGEIQCGEEIQITEPITTHPSNSIYGDKIVWQDVREGKLDIYMYDLTTQQETQITNSSNKQRDPSIFEDKIVFNECESILFNGTNHNVCNIYYYDLNTKETIEVTSDVVENNKWKGSVSIYGNKIVWEESIDAAYTEPNIYMYDLTTQQETQITSNFSQSRPVIYGDKIVWEDLRGNNYDIYMYDLTTQQETQITNDSTLQRGPSISGDKIVWHDGRNGLGNFDIYMYDLTTQQETQITDEGIRQMNPSISGDKIVWHDERSAEYNNFDIYMYDLTTQQETQITSNSNSQTFPHISGNGVIWMDGRDHTFYNNIYYMELCEPTTTTTTEESTGGGGGSSGGGTVTNLDPLADIIWTNTTFANETEFSSTQSFSTTLSGGEKLEIIINGETHSIGVLAVTENTVKIIVFSNPQEAVLTVGETRKFEVNGDERYDLMVTLDSINNGDASFSVIKIDEQILPGFEQQQQLANTNSQEMFDGEEINSRAEVIKKSIIPFLILTLVILIIVIISGIVVYVKKSKEE